MSPAGQNGVSSQGVGINGVQVKQALAAASETVAAGVYDATTLSAVDADLDVAKIKSGETIFGFAGTLSEAPTPTYDRYYTADLAILATYTPAVAAIFSAAWERATCNVQLQGNAWTRCQLNEGSQFGVGVVVGDGTNLRFSNQDGSYANNIVIMRYVLSGGTYEREYYADLAGTTRYTPAVAGIFSLGTETVSASPKMYNLYSGSTWWKTGDTSYTSAGGSSAIGDGTNLSVYNTSGAAKEICLMRAKPI